MKKLDRRTKEAYAHLFGKHRHLQALPGHPTSDLSTDLNYLNLNIYFSSTIEVHEIRQQASHRWRSRGEHGGC